MGQRQEVHRVGPPQGRRRQRRSARGPTPTPRPSSATRSAIRSRTPPVRRSTSSSSCWRRSPSSSPRCSSADLMTDSRVGRLSPRRGPGSHGPPVPGVGHGDRPGTHRVPADLVSAHLILVPFLFGWDDPFIDSLAFSVMLHLGTLVALLLYFRARLAPARAGRASRPIRDARSVDDPDRRLAWLLVAATIPAAIVGFLLNDVIETSLRGRSGSSRSCSSSGRRSCGSPTAGAARRRGVEQTSPSRSPPASASPRRSRSCPGISRSGISISAGLFAGLDRAAAARFSFLMATPITAGAVIFEARKLADAARPA